MKITCAQCRAVYSIDETLLAGGGIKAQCPACGHIEVVRKNKTAPQPPTERRVDEVFDVQPSELPRVEAPRSVRPPPMPVSGPPPLPGIGPDPFGDDPFGGGDAGPPMELQRTSDRSAAVPQQQPAEPQVQRCERCGAMLSEGSAVGDLCRRCAGMEGKEISFTSDARSWRVRKADGVILGPLTLTEVKDKFEQGEITAEDKVARGDGPFRLISSFAEFATFFRRPGEAFEMTFRHTPKSRKGTVIGVLAVLILAGAGVAAWYFWPRNGAEDAGVRADVLDEIIEQFRQEVPTPTGTSEQAWRSGRKFMLSDNRVGYLQADKAFKTAIILDPNNFKAYAGWVQNRALMDRGRGEVSDRKTALDLVDYGLIRHPRDAALLRAKAFLLFSLDRSADAREWANKALAEAPDDPESLLVLGASHIEASTEMAISFIRKALEAKPELNVAYRLLGEAHIRQGRFVRALEFFQNRLDKDPGEFEALQATARIYEKVGRFSKARSTYEILLAAAPNRPEAVVALARLYTQMAGQPQAAIAVLERALERADKMEPEARARLLAELSVAQRVAGSRGKAAESAERALQQDPACIPAQYARGVLDHEAGRVDPGLAHLHSLQAHMPHHARLRARTAELYSLVPNYPRAISELRNAVELDPDDLDVHLMMAVLYIYIDNPTQSFGWLKRCTTLDPFHSAVHKQTTPFYDGDGFMELSAKRANQAAQKYPEDPLVLSLAGAVLMRAGEAGQARQRLQAALQIDPECFHANLYMGILYLEDDRPSRAAAYLEAAHRGDSLHGMATKLLARAYFGDKKTKKAEVLLREVLSKAPGDLGAQLALAEVLLRRGKKKKAADRLLKIYRSDPDNLRVKKLLFKIGT